MNPPIPSDYYQLLGLVDRNATQQEIKEGYKREARKYHPDKYPDKIYAEERFKKIGEAYFVLKDESKRRQYDSGAPVASEYNDEENEAMKEFFTRFEVEMSQLLNHWDWDMTILSALAGTTFGIAAICNGGGPLRIATSFLIGSGIPSTGIPALKALDSMQPRHQHLLLQKFSELLQGWSEA